MLVSTLKRFVIYSLAVHAVILAVVLFVIPPSKTKKAADQFVTDLVSPEELFPRKSSMLETPKMKKAAPSRRGATVPAPSIHGGKSMPDEETSQIVPKSLPDEIKTDKLGSFPSFGKVVPGGISGETKIESSRSKNMINRGNAAPSVRDLFDKNIIGALAKRNIEREEKEINEDKPITLDTKEYKFWNYNQRLKERIESVWRYPDEAAQAGIRGDLVIKFSIKKNGQLGGAELIRGSGYPILDKAALEALKEASPYWPLPEAWGMDSYTLVGNFVYTISSAFIR